MEQQLEAMDQKIAGMELAIMTGFNHCEPGRNELSPCYPDRNEINARENVIRLFIGIMLI